MQFNDLLRAITGIIDRCDDRYGDYTSSHEALGVIAEEYHELIEAVKLNDAEHVRVEAIQLAAATLRLAAVCDRPAFRQRSGMTE